MARHFPHRKAAFILPLVFCLAACSHSPAESSKDSVSQSSQSVMTISCQAEASSEQSADPEKPTSVDVQQKMDTIRQIPAESVIDTTGLSDQQVRSLFESRAVTAEMLAGYDDSTFSLDQNFITPEQIRLVRLLYFGFDNQSHTGELLVNEKISQDVEEVFYELYRNAYPIEHISIPVGYNQDDNVIMTDNITRALAFTTDENGQYQEHEHSLGLAIDLNQLYNPQVIVEDGQTTILPPTAAPYADRTNLQPHMMDENDLAVQLFEQHGFTWGGIWQGRNDYQHFEKGFDHETGHIDPNLHYGS